MSRGFVILSYNQNNEDNSDRWWIRASWLCRSGIILQLDFPIDSDVSICLDGDHGIFFLIAVQWEVWEVMFVWSGPLAVCLHVVASLENNKPSPDGGSRVKSCDSEQVRI